MIRIINSAFVYLLFCFFSTCTGAVFEQFGSLAQDTTLLGRLDSLFYSEQKVFIAQRAGQANLYVGGVMETFTLPFKPVIALVQNYRRYTDYFSLAKDVQPAEDSTDWASREYYVELGTWSIPARIWSIVRVHELHYTDDSTATIFFSRISSDEIHDKWLEKNRSRHRLYGAEEFMGYWAVNQVAHNKVRIAFVALMDPGFYVPGWLMGFAWRVMLPKLLNDIEKTLQSESSKILPTQSE